MANKINTEEAPSYNLPIENQRALEHDQIIIKALNILGDRLKVENVFETTCPQDTKDYLVLKIAEKERELFGCLFLDNQHKLIKDDVLFYGTIDGASVYPREVVKAALLCNAAAVIFYHNHPSGLPGPSQADKNITEKLKKALSTVDIRSLDHVIIGGTTTYAFSEHGLI